MQLTVPDRGRGHSRCQVPPGHQVAEYHNVLVTVLGDKISEPYDNPFWEKSNPGRREAQAECLLSRLRNVGSGTGAANRRRQGVVREEVNWARERQAQAVGRRQGRKVVRHGMFLLNELGGRGVGDAPQYL